MNIASIGYGLLCVLLGLLGVYVIARAATMAYFKSKLDHYRDLSKFTPAPPRTPLNGDKK
jgi:hypothetical protein